VGRRDSALNEPPTGAWDTHKTHRDPWEA